MVDLLPDFLPDLSLRQPSITAVFPLFLTYYALAVLAILPNTFPFRLLLQPVFLWQARRCVLVVDLSAWFAQLLGLQSADRAGDRVIILNYQFVAIVFLLVLRSFEWTFIIKEPLRKYELTMNQNTPTEKRLSISSVLLDAFDLCCNMRGIGWSWSPKSLSQWSMAPHSESISSVFASFLFYITTFDTAQYLIQLVCHNVSGNPGGGSIFDPNLSFFPRNAWAAFASICGGVWVYSLIATAYCVVALIGRVVFRHPASHWPPISHNPLLSTSIHEFWSSRWHQLFRHLFITFGARPGGALLGRPGALMGGFAVSAVLHHVAAWGLAGYSPEPSMGGFFLLMGLGASMEDAFEKATGTSVQGISGWLWTTLWSVMWSRPVFDELVRDGMLTSEFFPYGLRPGKALVDIILRLPNITGIR
ncbi:hypothetical protein EDB83DRAFT_2478091 [Lactarius deliciosus]|nr:hypothetical protein EDB83DRAFT_2478091 [Lactarius deliciosus]